MTTAERRRFQAQALSALLDAIQGVRDLASTGRTELTRRIPLLEAVFNFDGDTPVVLYGQTFDFNPGLKIGAALSARSWGQGDDRLRMAVQILALSGRLWRSASAGKRLSEAIESARRQQLAFGVAHENTLQAMAQVYVDTIAPLGARIMVSGDPAVLTQDRVVTQIRALLLAAMRAAILWRHLDGSVWSLYFFRARWHREFNGLLPKATDPD